MNPERVALLRETIASVEPRHWASQPGADPTGTAELLAELADELLEAFAAAERKADTMSRHATLSGRLPRFGSPAYDLDALPMCSGCKARQPGRPGLGLCAGVGDERCGIAPLALAADTCTAEWRP